MVLFVKNYLLIRLRENKSPKNLAYSTFSVTYINTTIPF
jgi:hypothetical protein